MGRANFSVEQIKSYIYVCEDHFDEYVELDYRKVRQNNMKIKYHKYGEYGLKWNYGANLLVNTQFLSLKLGSKSVLASGLSFLQTQ